MNDKITEIKTAMNCVTGIELTNFDDIKYTNVVYEYDRLTETTCDVLAQCKDESLALLFASAPEYITYLLQRVEPLIKALRDIDELQTDYNANKDIRVKRIIKEALSII